MFIASKSRLVPLIQKPNIPRLELWAAVIATRIANTIVKELPIEKWNTFLWTDSRIVLNYLDNNDTNFGVYIAHRINEIKQSTDPDNWRYIKTVKTSWSYHTLSRFLIPIKKWLLDIWAFLKEEPCFEMSNNSIIVQTLQSNMQNKSHNLFINNIYPQINRGSYSSLEKQIRAISCIKKLD